MLTVLRARASVRPYSRSFVSSVLLTRTYDNESVAELRKLAKDRGISPKGNKSTLITRIQQHDQQTTLDAVSSAQRDPPVPAGIQVRQASASSVAPATSGSEISGPVPGIPPAAQTISHLSATAFTNIKLPDLTQPIPESPTPIPFLPDFYDSINQPTPYIEAAIGTPVDSSLPKILVVAGSATHHGGGPSHNLHDGQESTDRHEHGERLARPSEPAPTSSGGFWRDVAQDIGLPTSFKAARLTEGQRAVVDSLMETTNSVNQEKQYSRPLDKQEQRGVWVLLGLLGGSWLLGGVMNGSAKEEPEHQAH